LPAVNDLAFFQSSIKHEQVSDVYIYSFATFAGAACEWEICIYYKKY